MIGLVKPFAIDSIAAEVDNRLDQRVAKLPLCVPTINITVLEPEPESQAAADRDPIH